MSNGNDSNEGKQPLKIVVDVPRWGRPLFPRYTVTQNGVELPHHKPGDWQHGTEPLIGEN